MAGVLRGVLSGLWGDALPFLTFIPAMVLSAWAGGFWPGMLTTVLGAAIAEFFWLAPFYSFRVSSSLSAGYSMHVAKPVDPVELGVIVANLAGRSLSG
jgi:K+-sensing histidine kinase KdpD